MSETKTPAGRLGAVVLTAVEVLRQVQWSGWGYSEQDGIRAGVCPMCLARREHTAACAIAAALAAPAHPVQPEQLGGEGVEAELAALRFATEYQKTKIAYIEARLPPCRCGHNWLAHCGHAYSFAHEEPHHCSQGDGCRDYAPAVQHTEEIPRGGLGVSMAIPADYFSRTSSPAAPFPAQPSSPASDVRLREALERLELKFDNRADDAMDARVADDWNKGLAVAFRVAAEEIRALASGTPSGVSTGEA